MTKFSFCHLLMAFINTLLINITIMPQITEKHSYNQTIVVDLTFDEFGFKTSSLITSELQSTNL